MNAMSRECVFGAAACSFEGSIICWTYAPIPLFVSMGLGSCSKEAISCQEDQHPLFHQICSNHHTYVAQLIIV